VEPNGVEFCANAKNPVEHQSDQCADVPTGQMDEPLERKYGQNAFAIEKHRADGVHQGKEHNGGGRLSMRLTKKANK
jgi:hypothetical protein